MKNMYYDSVVINAQKKFLRWQDDENRSNYEHSRPSLWPSDIFSCHRKSAYHLLNEEQTLAFGDDSLFYMDSGKVLENATYRSLKHVYEDVKQDYSLKNDIWSGKADFIINHQQPNAIIIEHKATSSSKFKTDKDLPKKEHVGQLVLYGKLYLELYNIKPKLILYYRGWGCEAEFEILKNNQIVGIISNYSGVKFVSRKLRANIEAEISQLESMYKTVLDGGSLPNRLDKKYKGCEFMGKPSCSYYYNCWGNK